MSKFNTPARGAKTVNRAGGEAYIMSTKEKLATILLTSFVQNQFYRSQEDTIGEIKDLVQADPLFAAKASIYARNEFGMRSVSHVVAGEIFRTISGQPWVKRYIDRVVFRPDDISEIVSYYQANVARQEPLVLPGQMKKGLAAALTRFDKYQLAKYRGENKEWSLVDVVNLVRPKHTDAIKALVDGTLKNTNTWESKLSASGGSSEKKAEAWASLISENRLGYLALLRNLNNIAEQAPEVLGQALEQLVDEKRIRKSLVLPFQYMTAMTSLESTPHRIKILRALNKATEISLANVPHFDGDTLVVVDNSGSMHGSAWRGDTDLKAPIRMAALFAAVLVKTNEAGLMMFSDDAEYMQVNPDDSLGTLFKEIGSFGEPNGTNFHAPFQAANRKYDRMIILSDEQGWMGHRSPASSLEEYKRRLGANPFVYMWDLSGYGSLQLPQNQVALLAGFSEKVFDIMKLLETDKKALVNKIESINL